MRERQRRLLPGRDVVVAMRNLWQQQQQQLPMLVCFLGGVLSLLSPDALWRVYVVVPRKDQLPRTALSVLKEERDAHDETGPAVFGCETNGKQNKQSRNRYHTNHVHTPATRHAPGRTQRSRMKRETATHAAVAINTATATPKL